MKISKLFGNRVALQLIEEEYKGLIVPVPTQEKLHVLSRVIAVGNEMTQDLKVNDIVFWQTNGMIEKHCRYQLNGQAIFVMMAGDMVARLTSPTVTIDNFHVLGSYCLVKREIIQPSKLIHVPGEVAEANQETMTRFILVQKGELVSKPKESSETGKRSDGHGLDVEAGDDIILDRTRANLIQLGKDRYCYIHANFVLGVTK